MAPRRYDPPPVRFAGSTAQPSMPPTRPSIAPPPVRFGPPNLLIAQPKREAPRILTPRPHIPPPAHPRTLQRMQAPGGSGSGSGSAPNALSSSSAAPTAASSFVAAPTFAILPPAAAGPAGGAWSVQQDQYTNGPIRAAILALLREVIAAAARDGGGATASSPTLAALVAISRAASQKPASSEQTYAIGGFLLDDSMLVVTAGPQAYQAAIEGACKAIAGPSGSAATGASATAAGAAAVATATASPAAAASSSSGAAAAASGASAAAPFESAALIHLGPRATGIHGEISLIEERPGLTAVLASQDCCLFCYGALASRGYHHQPLRGEAFPKMWEYPFAQFKLVRINPELKRTGPTVEIRWHNQTAYYRVDPR